jgi:glutaredoxin
MMAKVRIFTKPECPYCAAAKEHYAQQGIVFEEINIVGNREAQKELLQLSGGKRLVPVVVDGGQVRVGWDGG